MHLLVAASGFPSQGDPYSGSFIAEQVRMLSERIERITVLSPTPRVPAVLASRRRFAAKAARPDRYCIVPERCDVLFPRYLKPPSDLFLGWTTLQWRRIVGNVVARFAKTQPVSLIHAHYGGVTSWAALCAAQRHEIPCVVTYHGDDVNTILAGKQKGWKLCRDSFRRADLNLPVSRALEEILRRHGAPQGRCETLLLGVDQTRFFPPAHPAEKAHVLYVGRIEKRKGAFDLLRAWAKVRARCPDALLTIVGDDWTNGRFFQQARTLGVGDSIVPKGSLPGPLVADLMRQSRVLCLPSHSEGTPVCVMEALSCGLPIVATRVGGTPDIVRHGETGLLVEKGDGDGLAEALVRLLQSPAECARMGQAAWEFASHHVDVRKTARRLHELYIEAIATHSYRVFNGPSDPSRLPPRD